MTCPQCGSIEKIADRSVPGIVHTVCAGCGASLELTHERRPS